MSKNQFHRVVDMVLCADKLGIPAYLCDDGKIRIQSNGSAMVTIQSKDEIKETPGFANMDMKQKKWMEDVFDDAEAYFRDKGNEEARELLKGNEK